MSAMSRPDAAPAGVAPAAPIPFNRPSLSGPELRYVAEAAGSGRLAGHGVFADRCRALLERLLGAPHVPLTTSCTHALEMSALLLNITEGDEIIVPSYTFVSVPNAFVLRGARPVFADIRPDTLNIDETRLEALITPRTKAIVVMHYGGVACEMDAILDLATRRGVVVVEDNAHGLFARYRGRALGTMGALGTLSFHDTKNITCGEGGALIINDPALVARAEVIREIGTNRRRFLQGEGDSYTWIDLGSSYAPSELLAAFLYGQLEARETIQARRRTIWEHYASHLADWARDRRVRLPTVPAGCDHSHHLFYLILPARADRDSLIAHLAADGISAVFHYQPLHVSAMGRSLGGRPGDCPVTEDLSVRLLRLPIYAAMTDADLQRVVSRVVRWRP
jgi:dTDP-4-amino-4,6-dideoxygalactose transaminase